MHKKSINVMSDDKLGFIDGALAISNFRDKSTRTRSSYASAASMLGLDVLDFDETKSQISHGETTRESAVMLSFCARSFGIRDDLYIHEGSKYMKEVADSLDESYSKGVLDFRPSVINLQCDQDHPTQSVSDLMHLIDYFGGIENLKGKKLAMTWAFSPSYGKPLSVPQGIITLLTRFGMDVTLAHPPGYDLLPHTVEKATQFGDGRFKVVHSMEEAFKGADIVYPKSWAPFHVMEKRVEILRKAGSNVKQELDQLEKECIENNKKYMDWTCNEDMMKLTNQTTGKEALYMHCLPADITGVSCKNGEVDETVFERHRLSTYNEASHKPFVIAAAILHGQIPSKAIIEKSQRLYSNYLVDEKTDNSSNQQSYAILEGIDWPSADPKNPIDDKIMELSYKYQPWAVELLKKAIYAGFDSNNPFCGMSNNEKKRLEYFRSEIISNVVQSPNHCWFDDFGNLVWEVYDEKDGIPVEEKKVIFFDGHTDTVNPLPEEWTRKIGKGIDAYKGLIDSKLINYDFLKSELGYIPPVDEWKNLVFGRGSADQLSGVVQQIVATKILIDLRSMGSLKGVIVRSYGTVAEEDNDGGGPMFLMKHELAQNPFKAPDVVIHTEGTGCVEKGGCGIYIGQRGRMQIEIEVIGRSCHGSMPWMGLNPLEWGSRIIKEANEHYEQGIDFLFDPFLGRGTSTASWCNLSTPSNCAVPASFRFRFDRRLTVGETPDTAIQQIMSLSSIKEAKEKGLDIIVTIPKYTNPTWKGFSPGNDEIYLGWLTPPQHQAVLTAVGTYKRIVSNLFLKQHPELQHSPVYTTGIPVEPRVDRWIFSTDGVGFNMKTEDLKKVWKTPVPPQKKWVERAGYTHPAQIGFGIGYEQNTHKVGEFIDARHFPAAIGFLSRFPSLFYERT